MSERIKLVRDGHQPVEVMVSQVTPRSVATLFDLDAASVYLKEADGRMAYFPDGTGGPDSMDKVFKLNTQQGVEVTLSVEGVPCQSGASTSNDSVVSATNRGICKASGRPSFTSKMSRNTSSTMNLKIVKAVMKFGSDGKPTFEVKDQVFALLTEGTANVPHLLRVIIDEWGLGYVLVTKDGLKISDSEGTRGLSFWKVGSRKFYAVLEDQLPDETSHQSKGKRKRSLAVSEIRPEFSSDDSSDNDEPRIKKKPSASDDAVLLELQSLKSVIQGVVEVKAGGSKIPIGLLVATKSTFRCNVCLGFIKPPVIFTRCCKNILGCEKCVMNYFEKDGITEGMTKRCPICRADRSFYEICRINGMEEFLTKMSCYINGDDSDDYDPFAFP